MEYWEIILRLVLALLLGGLLGLERTLAHKVAGLRTFALVSLGSALFVMISELVIKVSGNYNIDPIRMASQVVAGIGFLGAGLIIFKESKLSGLTTAAGLWVASGLGIATGFGLYFLAVTALILTLFVLVILWLIENKLKTRVGDYGEN